MSMILSNGVEAIEGQNGNISLKLPDGKIINFNPSIAISLALWIIQNVNPAFYEVDKKKW